MKKKGFTLVEMLGVIVVLGIIALIVFPGINTAIKQARRDAFEASVNSIVRAMKTYAYDQEIITGKEYSNKIVDVTAGVLDFDGDVPEEGKIGMTAEKEIVFEMNDGTWCARKLDEGEMVISKLSESGLCDGSNINIEVSTGTITYVAPSETDTHLGILYFDPTDLTRKCTKEDAEANKKGESTTGVATYTGTKDGCMKWYVYQDNGDNVYAILNHNTTAAAQYDYEGLDESSGRTESIHEASWWLKEDTKDWEEDLEARFPTAYDIVEAADLKDFVSTSAANFYLGGETAYDSANVEKYRWLIENTFKYNVTEWWVDNYVYEHWVRNDKSSDKTFGYWTSTPSSGGSSQWFIYSDSLCRSLSVTNHFVGVRPVVTVPKTYINK